MTNCERYIDTLKQFGFHETTTPLGELLYYSNLPEKEYMVENHEDGTYVTVSNGDGTSMWFLFRNGAYAGHGSDI